MSAAPVVDQSSAEPQLPPAVAVFGVGVICLVAIVSAALEVLLVPTYIGGVVFPIAVLAAVVVNLALPHMVHLLVEWRAAVALPAVCWLLVAILIGFTNTSRSVLVPGYGQAQYVGLALYFVGTLAAFIGVIRVLPRVTVPSVRAGSARR